MKQLILTILLGTAAFAATPNARIAQGVRSGELTRHEARRLHRQDNRIDAFARHQRRDGGGLTFHERQRIDRLRDAQSRDIYRQKHDRQDR